MNDRRLDDKTRQTVDRIDELIYQSRALSIKIAFYKKFAKAAILAGITKTIAFEEYI